MNTKVIYIRCSALAVTGYLLLAFTSRGREYNILFPQPQPILSEFKSQSLSAGFSTNIYTRNP